jgi:hypothetical protein
MPAGDVRTSEAGIFRSKEPGPHEARVMDTPTAKNCSVVPVVVPPSAAGSSWFARRPRPRFRRGTAAGASASLDPSSASGLRVVFAAAIRWFVLATVTVKCIGNTH